ncbi:unnamed protein product [Peronospora destructor]|uniref:Uncharacterized protein n=1 Tax=Peronospora destructor TaxID=86335 RepID=A0AAV0VAJ5_9STRA|nr:unnamed protein product [Peronospora destructor]
MALRVAAEKAASASSPAVTLYRYITKQIPRVLTLYDIPMEPARGTSSSAGAIPTACDQETLMQWKQKAHLAKLLEHGQALRTPAPLGNSMEQTLDKFYAGVDDDEDEL